jgi:hypothetical protein
VKEIIENLDAMCAGSLKIGAVPFLLTVPGYGRELFDTLSKGGLLEGQRELNSEISRLSQKHQGCVFVDLFSAVVDAGTGKMADGVSDADGLHMTEIGYGEIAQVVAESLIPWQMNRESGVGEESASTCSSM